jgi:hypothetical protein
VLAVERAAEHERRVARLLVAALVEERALLGVGHSAGDQHAGGGEREQAGQQPRAQRGDHVRGLRSA